jgi:hypothetical protein
MGERKSAFLKQVRIIRVTLFYSAVEKPSPNTSSAVAKMTNAAGSMRATTSRKGCAWARPTAQISTVRAALVYPPLEETFTNMLKDSYTRQTQLQMVDANGDLQIEGEITGYDVTPQAVGSDAYATMTRLTITVKVTFVNTKESQYDFENRTFTAYQDFSSDRMLTDVQDELCLQISKELVDLIFNATLGNW